MCLTEKLYLIANNLGDLNNKGKVKAITANERGYARILDINRGLSLLLYHTLDHRLTMNLLITNAAMNRYRINCGHAVQTFLKFHRQNFEENETPQETQWINNLDEKDKRTIYSIDLTKLAVDECIENISAIKRAFLDQTWSKPNKL